MKTYIVTDPCYILTRDAWLKCCEVLQNKEFTDEVEEAFNEKVKEQLQKVSDDVVWVSSTIIGDWSNSVHGPNIIQAEFCADSGMVCIAEYTDAVKECVTHTEDGVPLSDLCYALFKGGDHLKVTPETSSGQLQLTITDGEHNEWTIDDPLEEYYDEDEEY